jgi:hypothetical protein
MTMDFFRDWWAFFAFVATGVFGWLLGVERNRWKINDLGHAMKRLEDRVKVLETQGSDEKVILAKIEATLVSVLATLGRLENRIDGKADR